jgi:hypothetical protein
MERSAILSEIKQYFDIEELVCNHVLERWGEDAWQFLDTGFLANLLVIRRDVIQRPMYCNNHKRGLHQRGLRCNLCEMVKEKDRPYLSAHILGKAGDFSVEGIGSASAMGRMRSRIKLLAQAALPVPLRMEADVSWLHIDVMPTPSGQKIYEFKA